MGRIFIARIAMQINPGERVLWLDVLNFSSVYKIYRNRKKVDKVIYLNKYLPLKPFVNFLSRKVVNIPILQLDFVSEPDVRMENVSLYEYIQNSLIENLNNLTTYKNIAEKRKVFASDNDINHEKYLEYIKESAYLLLYRPVATLSIAKYFQCDQSSIFFFRSNPLHEFITGKNPSKRIYFEKYQALFSGLVSKRSGCYFDEFSDQRLFKQKTKFFAKWILGLVGEFLSVFRKSDITHNNIGVELIQGKFRLDKNNDIFWLKDSNINPKTVKGILMVGYDNESFKQIKKTGIDLVITTEYLIKRPIKFFCLRKKMIIVKHGLKYYITSLVDIVLPFASIDGSSMGSWLKFVEVRYKVRVKYWETIYRNLGVKVLWSMSDIDNEKLIKSQALENIKGVYTGSHWSNFPFYGLWNQKCYDLTFAWSQHFIDSNFKRCCNSKCQINGYVSDYLFKKATVIDKHKQHNQFVITYFDNMIGNDLPYSVDMQKLIYEMLVRLLKKYRHVVLSLKPKRFAEIFEISNNVSELLVFIEKNRVKLFADESGERIAPHSVGSNSDLTVGMGISTAAAECCFAGTVSFHADLTGFVNNDFANNALGKAVFRDVVDLELAIEKQISGKGISIEECRELHKSLDPFQDGKAYLRVGGVLNKVQQNLELGMDRKDAIEKVELNRYNGY